MADWCEVPEQEFAQAYWALRPPYDAARQTAAEYWAAVLRRLARPADTDMIEKLRLADIDSWSQAAKPEPAAFHHAVTALRAAAADFLFVDDREENVRAAEVLGMNGHVFTTLDELAPVIDLWLSGSPASATT